MHSDALIKAAEKVPTKVNTFDLLGEAPRDPRPIHVLRYNVNHDASGVGVAPQKDTTGRSGPYKETMSWTPL
jgi:hypothetical protein